MGSSTTWILIASLAFLALAPGVLSETEIDMQITQSYARVGENITITCHIINHDGSTVFLTKAAGEGVYEPISANIDVLLDYKQTQRYIVSSSPMESDALYKLSIHNVNYEDSARYRCNTANDADQKSVLFEVYRNTEHLAFYVNGTEVEKDSLVDLEEGEAMPINCTAAKAVPHPKMHVLSGNTDITDRFSEQHHLVPECKTGSPCLLHFYYNSSLYNNMYKASWNENGNELKCKAIIEEKDETYRHNFQIVETKVKLNVTHAPVVNCSTGHYSAVIGASSKTIKCPVFSNPALQSDSVFLATVDKSMRLKSGESKDGVFFRFTESTEFAKPGEIEVTFTNVQRKHIASYNVEASNIIGDTNFRFDMSEREEENGGNGASVKQISFVSLILAMIVALFKH